MRIGTGYDVHRLGPDRKLVMGGVEIPYELGLVGHSDADVLLHAVMDALLGAAALGDIGSHFPDSDERYKGISSLKLLENVGKLLEDEHWIIENIDAVIIAERPKMRPYIDDMRANIAKVLGLEISQVSVKATTEEGLGFTGRGEGIAAQSVCLLQSGSELCDTSVLVSASDESGEMVRPCTTCPGCVKPSCPGGKKDEDPQKKKKKKKSKKNK